MKSCSGRCALVTLGLFTICMMQIMKLDPSFQTLMFGTSITREQFVLGALIVAIAYQFYKSFFCNVQK